MLFSFYSIYQAEKPLTKGAVKVVELHDGDVVSVLLDDTVKKLRSIGIDAPEIGQRPWGLIARKHLRELLDNSKWTIFLEFDVKGRDKYGRPLSYVNTPDGKMINIRMPKDGYAMPYTHSTKYQVCR